MRAAAVIVPLAVGLLTASPLSADVQQAVKVPRIGVLISTSSGDRYYQALREGLRELGYVEGRNIAIEWRFAQGRIDQAPRLATELTGLKVDVLVLSSTTGAQAAKQRTQSLPIVLAAVLDPVGSGLVDTLARPGGNVTGLSLMSPEVSVKRLELLLELLKRATGDLSSVAVLWNPGHPAERTMLKEIEAAASSIRVRLQPIEARIPSDLAAAFSRINKRYVDGLLVGHEALFFARRTEIVALAAKRRLPAIYGSREFVEAGGLMSYGPSIADSFRRAAVYVDKILKGAKPGDLPIEQPTKFELVINLKTAKALGVTIPQSVLLRADDVIR